VSRRAEQLAEAGHITLRNLDVTDRPALERLFADFENPDEVYNLAGVNRFGPASWEHPAETAGTLGVAVGRNAGADPPGESGRSASQIQYVCLSARITASIPVWGNSAAFQTARFARAAEETDFAPGAACAAADQLSISTTATPSVPAALCGCSHDAGRTIHRPGCRPVDLEIGKEPLPGPGDP